MKTGILNALNEIYVEQDGQYVLATDWNLIDRLTFFDDVTILSDMMRGQKNLRWVDFNNKITQINSLGLAETSVYSIKFPVNTRLDRGILYGCENLRSVSFPQKMEIVPEYICGNAIRLKQVKFNNASDIRVLGKGCFSGCGKLMLNIPEKIWEIKSAALEGTAAHELVIPKSCKHVYSRAFANMPNLEHVVIENPDTLIAEDAFLGCKKLAQATIGGVDYPMGFYCGDAMIRMGDTEFIHGVDVTPVRHIGYTVTYYHGYARGVQCLFRDRDLAVRDVSQRVMEKYVKNTKRPIGPAARFQIDISLQELYCQKMAAGPGGRFIVNVPKSHGMITDFDCARCLAQHQEIYNDCKHRYGLIKTK